ncbi:DUF1289 domain-containing protein [Jannaschia donghaensis]|uniref:Putative Fe-S protein n=1 Tax=Jannaschia donghaensis TaxID=420998 RepID=A0A0M6YLE1_9RHOB|nr:DUF1289 domain-containing protein [Jannaschia donghaensis]CTQ50649.1 putative Fe-S protein [Jannaschia donghaensis]
MTNDPTSDRIWTRAEIESPCVKLCVVHPQTRRCAGCHRTIDEIAVWSRLSPEDRRSVMDQLPARAAESAVRRGGRAGRIKREP